MRQLSDKYNYNRPLRGMFLAFNTGDDSPFIVGLDDQVFVPVFSTSDRLERFVEEVGHTEGVQVKQINDQRDFMASVTAQGVRVMLDPYFVDGKTRFTELMVE